METNVCVLWCKTYLKFLKVKEENFIQKAVFDSNQQTTCKHTKSNHKNSKTQNEGIWVNVW